MKQYQCIHADLLAAQKWAYEPNGLICNNIVQEHESREYGACTFILHLLLMFLIYSSCSFAMDHAQPISMEKSIECLPSEIIQKIITTLTSSKITYTIGSKGFVFYLRRCFELASVAKQWQTAVRNPMRDMQQIFVTLSAHDQAKILYYAVYYPNCDMIPLLLRWGAQIQLLVRTMTTPDFAMDFGNQESPWINAVKERQIDIVKSFIAHGADINKLDVIDDSSRNGIKMTALMVACDMGHTDLVTLLLNEKADRTIRGGYRDNETAYDYAQNMEIRALLEKHALFK